MRPLSLLSFITSIFFASFASAEANKITGWLELSAKCESIILDQDVTVFDGFEPAELLVDVDGLKEVSVSHPDFPLVASTVSTGKNWFLCVIAANPPLQASRSRSLIEAWSEKQRQYAISPEIKLINFNDKSTFDPVRVRCRESGGLVTILAFRTENGEFRIGVTDRLPSTINNPCLN